MNTGAKLVALAVRQKRLYPGEAIDLELPASIEKLVQTRGEAAEIGGAARFVIAEIDKHLIDMLGDQGQAKFGPYFYRVGAPADWKIKPTATTRFFLWVHAHKIADQLFNPNAARKTPLFKMWMLADPETGEKMTRGQWMRAFIDYTRLEKLDLDVIPESKWAEYMRHFPEGKVQLGGRPLTEGERKEDDASTEGDDVHGSDTD